MTTKHCPIIEVTADGQACGRCWHYLRDGETCKRHGNVRREVETHTLEGRLTREDRRQPTPISHITPKEPTA